MEKPTLIVPDASVVLGYILQEEPYEDQLQQLFHGCEIGAVQLLAPSLIIHELSNRLSRSPDFAPQLIQESLKVITTIEPTSDVITETFKIVKKYTKAVWYDAIYHATALVFDGILVTQDYKYYQITKAVGHSVFIDKYR